MFIRFLSIITLSTSLAFSHFALGAEHRFEGVYKGSMKLFAPEKAVAGDKVMPTREVPLQIGLVLTGRYTLVPKGSGTGLEEQQIINGTVLVDDEGGPYVFTKVTYYIDRSEIDIVYSRPQITLNNSYPSSFRLIGDMKVDGSIPGRVISGTRGYIGDFRVVREALSTIEVKQKYIGTWVGTSYLLKQGLTEDFALTIRGAVQATTNPPDFEFNFTTGRIGSMVFETVPMSFNTFAIDYLRGRAVLTDNIIGGSQTPSVSLEFFIDPVTGELSGTEYGEYQGRNFTFKLRKVEE